MKILYVLKYLCIFATGNKKIVEDKKDKKKIEDYESNNYQVLSKQGDTYVVRALDDSQ